MHFPGANYLHYWVCNDNLDTRMSIDMAASAGVTRFIIAGKDRATKNYREILLQFNWSEIAFLHDDKPFLYFRDGTKERVGHWELSSEAELEPLRKEVEKHRYIFVKTSFNFRYYSYHFRREYSDKVQWLYEFQRDNSDKHIIIYGTSDFELMFSMGMHGSGLKYNRSMNRLVWLPNGRKVEKYQILDEDLPGFEHLLEKYRGESVHFIAIKMWLMIPEWMKEFYSVKPLREPFESFTDVDYWRGYYLKTPRTIFMATEMSKRARYIHDNLGGLPENPNQATKRMLVTDGLLCDTCSLAYACKLYRKRGVCVVTGTEGKKLSELFQSTDADKILEGMGRVLASQADLVEASIENELREIRDGGQKTTSKDLNGQINDLFKNSAKMAVLRNPNLTRPNTAIQINNGGPQQKQIEKTERIALEITSRDKAQAIRELEAQGVDRDDMDSDMIIRHIHSKMNKQTLQLEGDVLEGEVIEASDVKDIF